MAGIEQACGHQAAHSADADKSQYLTCHDISFLHRDAAALCRSPGTDITGAAIPIDGGCRAS
jgi:hypothetical protein